MNVKSVLVGGWEFVKEDGIDKNISEMSNGKIVFIPDASKYLEKQTERAIDRYKKYNVEVLVLEEKAEEIPNGINVVYLGGGDPEKMMEYFQNHPGLLQNIKDKWLNGDITLCGSSTGAMVQFDEMLAIDSRGKGNNNLVPGLGLIKNRAVVIPHWNEAKGSQEWRRDFLQYHKDKLIITIDEYTGFFWEGLEAQVVGLGTVNIARNGEIQSYKNGDKILKIKYPKARVGIIGYPNIGKSSLINSLVGGRKAITSGERGQTKTIQKIRFSKNIVFLDTPGVIPDNEDSNVNVRDLKKHIQINVKTYDKVKNPDFIVLDLMNKYEGVLQDYYEIKTNDVEELLEKLGRKLKLLKKGGEVDIDRTARVIIKAIQEGKIKIQSV